MFFVVPRGVRAVERVCPVQDRPELIGLDHARPILGHRRWLSARSEHLSYRRRDLRRVMPAEWIPVHREVSQCRPLAGAARVAARAVHLEHGASALVRLLLARLRCCQPMLVRSSLCRLRVGPFGARHRRMIVASFAGSRVGRRRRLVLVRSRSRRRAWRRSAANQQQERTGERETTLGPSEPPRHGAATSSSPIIPRSACSRM